MTVDELIKLLQRYPGDANVVAVADDDVTAWREMNGVSTLANELTEKAIVREGLDVEAAAQIVAILID